MSIRWEKVITNIAVFGAAVSGERELGPLQA